MNTRLIPIAFLAALSVPGLCQAFPTTPPYAVLISNPTDSSVFGYFNDINAVHGLPVPKLLAAATAVTKPRSVSGQPEFSFMRDWDGTDNFLEGMVGYVATGTSAVDIALNPASPGTFAVELGGAYFNEWTLVAENGVFASEAARFTYTRKSIAQPTFPISGGQ